ncbi:MAG: hypothetical protein GY868_07775 [Deltaproteobacteria bacterium]|nr:hypothetical protein [Deltaproteobacteria bacterium]
MLRSGLAGLLLCIVFLVGGYALCFGDVMVVQDNEHGVILDVVVPDVTVADRKGQGDSVLSAEGFFVIGQPGAPGVLTRGVLVEIPLGCDIEVSAVSLESKVYDHVALAPAPGKALIAGPDGEKKVVKTYHADEALYAGDTLFPGELVGTEGTGFLRDKRVVQLALFPVQYNPLGKQLTVHTRLSISVKFKPSRPTGALAKLAVRPVSSRPSMQAFDALYKKNVINAAGRGGYVVKDRTVQSRRAARRQDDSPFAVKIVVEQPGMYRITYEDLQDLGIDLSGVTHENILMTNQDEEIAIYCSGTGVFGSGDAVVFYGAAFKSLCSKKNIYWLYQGTSAGMRMKPVSGVPSAGYAAPDTFTNLYYGETDFVYEINMPEGAERWFWTHFNINAGEDDSFVTQQTYPVDVRNFVSSGSHVSMRIMLRGETGTSKLDPDHHTRVYVNGNVAADFTWDGRIDLTQEIDGIPASYFVDGENIVTIEAVDDLGLSTSTGDSWFLNWFEISYLDGFVAEENTLLFTGEGDGGRAFRITGFTSDSVAVYDVTDSAKPVRITGTVSGSGAGYDIAVETTADGERALYAVGSGGFSQPAELVVDAASNLRGAREAVDYIMITHENFYDTVQELKTYRESRGLVVEVVKVQDIYDEFSAGIKDVAAIKAFLEHAYHNWHATDHPTYVALVGDATYDYRDDKGLYSQGKEDLVPSYFIYTDIVGDVPTDNWYVCVAGDDLLPEMFIGRLCVKTVQDLRNIIEKIKSYEKDEVAVWTANVILAADNEPMFESISDQIAGYLPDGFYAQKIYLSDYEGKNSNATDELIGKINAGAVITNYTGHGGLDLWADEALLRTPNKNEVSRNDVDRLANSKKLTFVLVLNCLSGYFSHVSDDYSIVEEFVRSKDKGAIAGFAATSSGYPSEHRVLAKNIFDGLFKEHNTDLGSLTTGAKIEAYQQIYSRDMMETFTLFGDPATQLKLFDVTQLEDFVKHAPLHEESLASFPPAEFSWGEGPYQKFKIQFSRDAGFEPSTTITVPLLPFLTLQDPAYKPNLFIWSLLRLMSRKVNKLYWRVLPYDADFNVFGPSNYSSFSIAR